MVDHNRQFENPEFDNTEFESSQLEHDLRQALRPRSAPPNFAARVMQQIPPDAQPAPQPPAAPAPRRARIFHFPALRLAAVASILIVVLAGTFTYQHHQRVLAGERARHQVLVALQITHATLQQVADNVSSTQNRKELHP